MPDRVEEIRRRRQLPKEKRVWTDRDIDALLQLAEEIATDLFELQDRLAALAA